MVGDARSGQMIVILFVALMLGYTHHEIADDSRREAVNFVHERRRSIWELDTRDPGCWDDGP